MIKIHILGCKIQLSFPLVCALAVVFILDTTSITAISIISAICHEMGHILAMRILNTKTDNIKLSLFDININDKDKFKRTLPSELFVIMAGIIVNIIICVSSYAVYKSTDIKEFLILSTANGVLAIFNMLPVDSLDGGNAIFLILIKFTSAKTAQKTLEIISFIVLLPLAVIGFIILLESKYNFTLLFTSVYLMSIIILKKSKVFWRIK